MTASSTEGTIGPSSIAHLPIHTTGASISTVNHITGRTTQLGGQTTLPKTMFSASHKSTTNQKPPPLTYASGTLVPTHKDSSPISTAPVVPGPTLATQLSPAKTGTYEVLNGSRLCIKAEMGLVLIVQEKDSVSWAHRKIMLSSKSDWSCFLENEQFFLGSGGTPL